jgi:hypothetical protein
MYSREGLRSISLKRRWEQLSQRSDGLVGARPARLAPGVGNGQIGARLEYGNLTKEKGCRFFQIPEAAGTRQFVIGCL